MHLDYQYLLDEHKKELTKTNLEGWKFSKVPKQYNLNRQKDFCFSLGRDWCITIRYS
ncbi:hypothetical protein ACTWQB_04270 [Piscibacillus sp. B03]|uniref:hypothetical protein n=1 Tax=Piscibacillus sp. B03 TaxID=3457430 RepID=UPI003FCE1C70